LRDRPYVYAEHLLPHDVQVQEMGTGKSRLEVLAGLGIRAKVVPQLKVDDGIQAVRALLPRCWFDAEKCARGVEALRNYRRAFDISLGHFRPTPVHDWSSHGADAFRYLAVGLPSAESKPMEPIEYSEGGIV
jgi:phage terminase large subunit